MNLFFGINFKILKFIFLDIFLLAVRLALYALRECEIRISSSIRALISAGIIVK